MWAFFCEFCEIFQNTFFREHLWWLFLEAVARSSFYKKAVCQINFSKCRGKHMRWKSLFSKVAVSGPAILF